MSLHPSHPPIVGTGFPAARISLVRTWQAGMTCLLFDNASFSALVSMCVCVCVCVCSYSFMYVCAFARGRRVGGKEGELKIGEGKDVRGERVRGGEMRGICVYDMRV